MQSSIESVEKYFFIRDPINASQNGSTRSIKRLGTNSIEDLLQGKKNPVQCLNEYCSMTKKTITFTETGLSYQHANYATIDGVQFPQVGNEGDGEEDEYLIYWKILIGCGEK